MSQQRQIWVEGKLDLQVYQTLYEYAIAHQLLDPEIKLHFISADLTDSSGGRDKVIKMVSELRKDGLETVFGIIDHDEKNMPQDGIFVLHRYSLENYLLDPILIEALLLKNWMSKDFFAEFNLFELSDLANASIESIQIVIKKLCEKVAEKNNLTNDDLQEILYANWQKLYLPDWMIKNKGHILDNYYTKTFHELKHIGWEKSIKDKTIELLSQVDWRLPAEIIEIFKNIQKNI